MSTVVELLEFLGKSVLVFVTFAASVAFVLSRTRARRTVEPTVQLREIGARWRHNAETLKRALLPDRERRKAERDAAKRSRSDRKRARTQCVFVVDFKGDILATAVESLREEVTTLLAVASEGDRVVVRLESPGGAVHGYGLAASQLARIRARGIPLTVCVDKIAASGGYLMACVADRIVAAPFAVVGSIGVVAAVPNLHRVLERWGVDYEDVTAGKYKRTVSLLGPIREEGRAKLQEQIDETHGLFKAYVRSMRPALDVDAVATGEHWYGTRALEVGLVDALGTSDDCLIELARDARVFEVTCDRPMPARERILGSLVSTVERLAGRWT